MRLLTLVCAIFISLSYAVSIELGRGASIDTIEVAREASIKRVRVDPAEFEKMHILFEEHPFYRVKITDLSEGNGRVLDIVVQDPRDPDGKTSRIAELACAYAHSSLMIHELLPDIDPMRWEQRLSLSKLLKGAWRFCHDPDEHKTRLESLIVDSDVYLQNRYINLYKLINTVQRTWKAKKNEMTVLQKSENHVAVVDTSVLRLKPAGRGDVRCWSWLGIKPSRKQPDLPLMERSWNLMIKGEFFEAAEELAIERGSAIWRIDLFWPKDEDTTISVRYYFTSPDALDRDPAMCVRYTD